MQCTRCGAENREGARFCEDCGAPAEVTCPSCGTGVTPGKRFCGDCGAALAGATSVPATRQEGPSRQASAPLGAADERRWATVLFADLTGYTSLSERMDPEDVQELTHRCAERLSSEVRRFGGTVVNVMGDGVLAVFGAPVAHEDDAERAVRAALAIRDCSLTMPGGHPLQMHVGVNTGEVMAGLVGPEEHRDYTVVGDTVNTAARLMAAAPAGGVLVGEETYRATHRTVGYRAVDPVEARGKERPVLAWEALDASTVPEARPLGTAPFVGRVDELAALTGIWTETVREARPRLVTVLGEPGIGKSRLVAELERRALGNATVLHGRCLPYGTVLGYWAIATVMKEAAGIAAEDNSRAARAKLSELVAGLIGTGAGRNDGDPSEVARHLALLVGLDVEEDRAVPAGDQRTLHASARRFFEALAQRRPLCLLLEDIHWADDALLDLIDHVAARASDAPLMIVTQARPELLEHRPSWGRGVPAHTSLRLEPLGERDGHGLILALCREHGLPSDVAEQVGRGAGGNPLFAEELVATIAERRGGAGHVPSAIKALISARLDALSADQRWMLQLASVVGKHFWEGSVSQLSRRDGRSPTTEHVTELLDALVQKDLVRLQPRSRFRGDLEYSFKHDLIRDVAYEMLPRRERRALHAQAADWIEQVEGERADELLDVLAHHALHADQQGRALGYLIRATERARRAAAHREEGMLLVQAIEIAEQLGEDDTVAELRSRRGRAFFDLGSWAEARAELETALPRISADHPDLRIRVLLDLAGACGWLMDAASQRRHASEALELAEHHARPRLAVVAHGWLSHVCTAEGDVDGALALYEHAVAQSRELGIAPPALPLVMGAATYYWAGRVREATACARDAITSARERNDSMALMFGLPHLGVALAAEGQYDAAARVFDEARAFGQEHEVFTQLARSIAMSAGFHLDVFDYGGNEALAEEARDRAQALAFPPPGISASIDLLLNFARRGEVGRTERLVGGVAEAVEKAAAWHGWLWKLRLAEARAEIALAREEWEEAIHWADEAINRSRTHRRPKYEALGAWTRARALQALGRTTEAVVDLRRATELARSIGDPAQLLLTVGPLLAIDGDDTLAAEARAAVERISAALPDAEMHRRFEAAESVRLAKRVAGSADQGRA